MKLLTAPYCAQLQEWPATGRHILAQYDDEAVVVYQAFRPETARYAAEHGHFGLGFSLERMSWIKPNFLWMMYRNGWGTKPGQEVTLAIWLERAAFDAILAEAKHSSFVPTLYDSETAWKAALAHSEVRLQWDPDHDPAGQPLKRRAIQLGLRGGILSRYARDWICHIADVSAFVAEQRAFSSRDSYDRLQVPQAAVYPVARSEVAMRLGIDTHVPDEQGSGVD